MTALLSPTALPSVHAAAVARRRRQSMADGYASRLLAEPAGGRSTWLGEAALVGGLSGAAALAWRGLAAHPTLRLAAAGYLAAEGLFYLVGRLR